MTIYRYIHTTAL